MTNLRQKIKNLQEKPIKASIDLGLNTNRGVNLYTFAIKMLYASVDLPKDNLWELGGSLYCCRQLFRLAANLRTTTHTH